MKWRPRDFADSLFPLTTFYAMLGHGVFRSLNKRQHPKFSVIYAITITFLFYLTLGSTMYMAYNAPWYHTEANRFYAIAYVHVVIGAISQCLSWYYRKTAARFVKSVIEIDDTLQKLGATFDYTAAMKKGTLRLCSWIFCSITLNVMDVLWLLSYVPFGSVLLIVTVLHFPIHVNSIVAVNFSIMVGLRFRKANELLEKITKPVRKPVNIEVWRYFRTKISPKSFTISPRQVLYGSAYKKHSIQIIKQVHLELKVVAREVNRVFSVQVVLELSGYFVLVTSLLYDVFSVATDPALPKRFLRFSGQVVWCITYMVKLVLMNQCCEVVVAEAHRTGDILHFIDEAFVDPELNDEIRQFTFQMAQNHLLFSPLGLITLGWQFVRGFCATLTTYLIILIQNTS